jgi:methyl-accepting chemotaxis protein
MVKRGRRSIAWGFITIVFAVLAVGQLLLGVWFLFDQRELHRNMMLGRAGLSAGFLARASADVVRKGDYDALRKITRDIGDEDIISIKILDKNNITLMYHELKEESRSYSVNPFFVPWRNTVREQVVAGGRPVGTVEMVYSGESTNELMLSLITRPIIVQIIIFALVIYAVYFFFQKRVGGPIDVIRDRMERITEGDISVRIPEMGDDEIGAIATGLRFIVERLSSTALKLNVTAENVGETVNRLDRTFDDFADMIKKQTSSTDDIANSLHKAGESQREIAGITDELSGFSAENVAALLEVKAMADGIVKSMGTLFKATESSYSTVAQMAQTSKVMARNSHEILTSVERTSSSVTEVIASVKEVERNAKKSSALAESVREEAAKRGVVTVAEAVEGMKRIAVKVQYSMDVVRQLHKRSMDVERILSVVREVTEQTNLLSLNASILAEKAGEYGKGFSVVADEMRALSDRTASYTKEIGGIVKTIQKEIEEVVTSIEQGVLMVKEGSDRVYNVGETMSDILEEAHNSALMTRTIERATEEQVKALAHFERAMVDISSMASGMSATMEDQITGSSHMLDRVAEVREVAEVTKKGTDEQAAATSSISRNFESANEKLSVIRSSVSGQQRANDGILSAVEDIRQTGLRNVEKMEAVSGSLDVLLREIATLKKEMEIFRV